VRDLEVKLSIAIFFSLSEVIAFTTIRYVIYYIFVAFVESGGYGMELLFLLGFGLLGAGLAMTGDDDEESAPAEGFTFDDDQAVGTENDDILTVGDFPEGVTTIPEILGQGGDDLIDLNVPPDLYDDFGDDVINANGVSGRVDGGAGDDTITGFFSGGTIAGGAGDDSIDVASLSSDSLIVDGGEGDDFIDATDAAGGQALGGAGNDTIVAQGVGEAEGGSALFPDGGEGDDLIRFTAYSDFFPGYFVADQVVRGGEGADTFEILVNEGQHDSSLDDDVYSDTSLWSVPNVEIADFEPGVDKLVIEASRHDDAYELADVRMEEVDDGNGGLSTNVILAYEHDTLNTREIVVSLNATGVSCSDIEVEYLGETYPVPTT